MPPISRPLFAALAGVFLLAAGGASAGPATVGTDQEIRNVVEAFRLAIIAKDKEGFLRLFYPGAVSWVGVYGDASLKEGKRHHPERGKAYPGSPATFIEMLAGSGQRFEEKFGTISISADADVATVSFDYEFLKDGAATNHGRESWQLVRTGEGWKINSAIYSVNF